ncbi:hypothetical protein V496_10330 [Pseudogymnoascus sp. VKM F-4515 (FW-2607)]|nr:hypothetical protein V496_10330 [Pseudogymnoascus sp. VKM F-4515 (FW-2607)]
MIISRSAARSLDLFKRSSMSQGIATKAALIEEGTLQHYDPKLYYPARINELFHHRYRTCVKLGYGGYSTVWLCRDEADCSYKVLKIGTCKKDRSMTKEAQVLEYLNSRDSVHNGRSWVRDACDIFQIDVPSGSHTCLVFEPLGISLSERIDLRPAKRLEQPIVKLITYCLLLGIDYLHTLGYLNPDIKLDNIQEALPDDGTEILTRLVNAEKDEPGPQRIVNDRVTIYTSRSMDYEEEVVYPILADMGMAVFGETEYSHIIQPIPYRAPEVILGMKWKESVDIWNIGVLVWELLCGEHLFGKDNEQEALAKMIRYLGLPPVEFLKRSDVHLQYFDEQGNWRGIHPEPTALKDRLEGAGDIDLFLDFVRPMLSWEPEKRPTAAALLAHPWLQS